MVTLSLEDIESAVLAAFNRYLARNPTSFTIRLSGYQVRVDITPRGNRFDCGIPGYNMANANVGALKTWVPNNIKVGAAVGGLAPCENVGNHGQVNVVLRVAVMFNFHVNLVNPCS